MAADTTVTYKVESSASKCMKVEDSELRVSDVWRRVERMHLAAARAARAAIMISAAEERAPENHDLASLARHVRTHAYVATNGGCLIVEQALQNQTDIELQLGGSEIGARIAHKAAEDAWSACEEALCLISIPPPSSSTDCLSEHEMSLA